MAVKFRSVRRQLKRGNLKLVFREEFVRWEHSHVTGMVTPVKEKVPHLMRRTNAGTYVPYT